MSRALQGLPDVLLRLLDGNDLRAKSSETIQLLTTTTDGYPHVALLSVGEVFAPSAAEVRLALWHASRTTENLERDGKGTLAFTLAGPAYYVEIEARRRGDITVGDHTYATFRARVRGVLEDVVGYAALESGIRFTLRDPDRALARWRAQVDALRADDA